MDTANNRDTATGYAVCMLGITIGLLGGVLPVDLALASAGLLGIAAARRRHRPRAGR
jgi:hypothetical protein